MNNLKAFLPHCILVLGLFGILNGEGLTWLAFIILFVLFPVIEWLFKNIKIDQGGVSATVADFALMATTPLLMTILVSTFLMLQNMTSFLEQIGLVLSAGTLLGAFGITSAHEMVHRREKHMRFFGVLNLMLVNFAHWGIEHVFNHHKHVATRADTATAVKNQSVYSFWIQDYFGGLHHSYKALPRKVASYGIISLVGSLVIYSAFNFKTVLVWWAISFIAIVLLLTVDYIEHYGLERAENTAIKPFHSWDTSSWITNLFLFNLGFHAHHHMKAVVHYEELKTMPEARQLPYGYSVMVVMALLPFVYFSTMNKKLEGV